MVKLTKTTAFKPHNSKPEMQIDKTSRIVKEMSEHDAAERKIKNDRLRNARLEREAHTPPEPTAKAKRKTGASKTVQKP
jgi:hypothetical protein